MAVQRLARLLLLAVPLVPAAFFLQHAEPFGMPTAQGCSGGGNVPEPDGWWLVSPSTPTESSVVPLATDGFFVIIVGARGLSAEQVQADLSVSILTLEGAPVPGQVSLLKQESADSYLLGWTATDPLPEGTQLSGTLSAPATPTSAALETSLSLAVSGERVLLSEVEPLVVMQEWEDHALGSGELTTCPSVPDIDSCGEQSLTISLAADETPYLRVPYPAWELRSVSGSIAWEARLEVEPGVQPESAPTLILADSLVNPPDLGDTTSFASFASLLFPVGIETACVTLVVKELRSGEERRFERCSAVPEPEHVTASDGLASCAAPPSEARTERWCKMHPDSTLPACAPFVDSPAPTPAAGGSLANGGGSSSSGGGSSSGGSNAAEPPARGNRTSSGCHVGGSGGAGSPAASLVGLLGLLVLGARRARARGR